MKDNNFIDGIMTIGIGLMLGIFIIYCFVSCRSIQTSEQLNYRDSVVTKYVYDTTKITISDTTHIEVSTQSDKESKTIILFGNSGGSYNALTGQADNVQSIEQSGKENELSRLVADYKSELQAAKRLIELQENEITVLKKENELLQNTEEIKPSVSGWHRFLVWWFWISIIVVLVAVGWQLFKRFYLHI